MAKNCGDSPPLSADPALGNFVESKVTNAKENGHGRDFKADA
jgi:hypothetical protein